MKKKSAKKKKPAEPWWKTGVIYQIYVRSFNDSNGDGIGDLPGITAKLDYLNDGTPDSLGVDAIWLTPFYQSPNRDFGYDVSDYRSVHPEHGTMEDFDHLLEEAHKRGIRVILDFVPNHTSDEHPWFVEARKSKDSPKRDWFVWQDPKPGGKPPNSWQAAPGGSGWELDERTGQYFYHAFFDFQPDLNWRNPEVAEAVLGDMDFWLNKGVDGFRLDLINYLLEDEQFRDNARSLAGWYMGRFQDSKYTRDLPETHQVLTKFRKLLDKYRDRMMVGEVISFPWEDSAAPSYSNDRELHLAFNMEFLAVTRFSPKSFSRVVDNFERRLPADGWPAYVLSNHDMPRHMGRFGGKLIYGYRKQAFARARVCAALLLLLRGTPFLFYGEEIGLSNRWFGKEHIKDPMGKKFWPLYQGRDASRTPMLWESGEGAGFTTSQPWLPLDPDADRLNARTAGEDPRSLLNLYRSLIWLRKQTPALCLGDYQPQTDLDPRIYGFKRVLKDQSVIVLLNFSSAPAPVSGLTGRRILFSDAERKHDPGADFALAPFEILLLEE